MTLNGFCTAKLIDSKSGEVVAVSHHPSGLLFGYSEHQGVIAATERTSKEIARILADMERKNQLTPQKIEKTRTVRELIIDLDKTIGDFVSSPIFGNISSRSSTTGW